MTRRPPRAGLRARWITVVYAYTGVGDACRVLLLLLAETMTDSGYVSVPRDVIADKLAISERRVTDRITEATRAGLLSKTGGGYKGKSAEYVAQLPEIKVAAERPPLSPKGGCFPSTYNVHLSVPHSETKVAAERPPNTRARAGASQTETRERTDTAPDSRADYATPRRSDEETTHGQPSSYASLLAKSLNSPVGARQRPTRTSRHQTEGRSDGGSPDHSPVAAALRPDPERTAP